VAPRVARWYAKRAAESQATLSRKKVEVWDCILAVCVLPVPLRVRVPRRFPPTRVYLQLYSSECLAVPCTYSL